MDKQNFTSPNEAYEISEFMSTTFMFKGLDNAEIQRLLNDAEIEICSFENGEKIFTEFDFERKIGFVLDGTCEVKKTRNERASIPLNSLTKGDSFGILSIFSGGEKYPTEINAKKAATVLFIPKDDVVRLVEIHPKIAKNIICFLSDRVNFLNDKISTFSADNVEQKFSNYLMINYSSLADIGFEINHKRAAEAINSGRASLYRAIDSLRSKGIIKTENKKIYITDLEGLERNSK